MKPGLFSLRRLLAEPLAFTSRRVGVVGLADTSLSRPRIFASRDDLKRGHAASAVTLDVIPPDAIRSHLHHRWVVVEGTFGVPPVATDLPGAHALFDLERLEPWSDPAKPGIPGAPVPVPEDIDPGEALDSVRTLLEAPDASAGAKVSVTGFAASTFEHNALYVSEEAYRNGVTKDAIWIARLPDARSHEKYVRIDATFDARATGHLGMFGGTLRDLTHEAEVTRTPTSGVDLLPADWDALLPALLERAAADRAVVMRLGRETTLFFAGTPEIAARRASGEDLARMRVLGTRSLHIDTGDVDGSNAHLAHYLTSIASQRCRVTESKTGRDRTSDLARDPASLLRP